MGICQCCCNDLPNVKLKEARPKKKAQLRHLLSDLRTDFDEFAGEDQMLDADELASIWRRCAERRAGKLSVEDEALIVSSSKECFALMDFDRAGRVNYEEFAAYMAGGLESRGPLQNLREHVNIALKKDPEKLGRLLKQFKSWDKNGDGFVSPEEMQRHLEELERLAPEGSEARESDICDAEWTQQLKMNLFAEADVDTDGRLDLWEFIAHALGRRKIAVEVLLYDISGGAAKRLGPLLLGRKIEAVHSAVLVYGSEYWYGGNVFKTSPPCERCFGKPLSQPWGETIDRSEYQPDLPVVHVGYTFVTHEEFNDWLKREMVPKYSGIHSYDLLTRSCNHFSNEVVTFLTGEGLPEKILELQKLALTPAVRSLRPFLNKHLGGFSDAYKDVDDRLFSKDYMAKPYAITARALTQSVLGTGNLVSVEGLEGVEGSVVATVLSEEQGVCEVKYFDPLVGELVTKQGVLSTQMQSLDEQGLNHTFHL
mmetsp:Transcript_108992/g.307184  ORF Transcript_108992/g.307184 Transcript_108992/m.307184 type:complete len:482 (-) Transcript_108992:106-1551(-)